MTEKETKELKELIIEGLRQDDQDAWQTFWNRYFPKLEIYLANNRPIKDPQIRESAIRSAIQTVGEKIADGKKISKLTQYLRRAAKNKETDKLRKLFAQKRDVRRNKDIDDVGVNDCDQIPEVQAMIKEKVLLVIDGLDENYQKVFGHWVAGQSKEGIADHLGVSVRTVERYLFKIEVLLNDSLILSEQIE